MCIRDDGTTVDTIRTQITQDYQTKPHSIIDKLMLVTADGIAPGE